MKIAALCDFPFWEKRIGSAVRMSSLCDTLARHLDLTVISSVVADRPARRSAWSLRGADELGIEADMPREDIAARIAEAVIDSEADAVLTPYLNRGWMASAVPRDVLRVVDTHDCQSQRAASLARHGLKSSISISGREEGAALDRYDLALAMSQEDAMAFRQMTRTPLVIAPFRLPLAPLRDRGDGQTLLFVAADSPVNRVTLHFLIREILPLVRAPFRLRVVGSVDVPEIPDGMAVEVLRDVPDLKPIYAETDLALSPIYAGGGVKTKTLEPLCYGRPVMTTDEGARGLRHLIPDDLIANDKETFAYRIGLILSDAARRKSLSQDIIRRVRNEDVESWIPPFKALLGTMCATKSGAIPV
ncbi:glycosyltransferase [Jannaschia aquimarina]|uniref:Glycosyl transferases group 1 n=1 Tax=Jannaschia aquimarina TaxID=935700 RepID=A0A0D1EBM3_9RHOB|nr:glycosyltransferase [Jannaschia aquimarina]KIT15144.1 hypothetical protein jaqu_34720 [Jannaschia aquimarina]SNS65310.1 Glycosyl transferases group 1 [Jannaschia aquimarina]